MSVGWIVGIAGGVVILILLLVVPWDKLRSKRDRLHLDDKNSPAVKESPADNAAQQSTAAQIAENRYFGIFNFFTSKTSIRYETLVYVQPEKDSCPLCQAFENQVLSLEKVSKNYITMSEAISRGYHHLGCKHIDIDYLIAETKIAPLSWTKTKQNQWYKLRLKQYRWEDKLRQMNYQIDNAHNKDEQKPLIQAKQNLEVKYQKFLNQNKLTRNKHRELPLSDDLVKWS